MSKKRDARREAAHAHIAYTRRELVRETMDAVETKKRYRKGCLTPPALPHFDSTEIGVADMDSVSALLAEKGRKAVLDFASYHHPGGGYEDGAWAQEEALCSESNLYDVLDALYDEYYLPHKKTHRGGLYTADSIIAAAQAQVLQPWVSCNRPFPQRRSQNAICISPRILLHCQERKP